jgi:hypothetical protein
MSTTALAFAFDFFISRRGTVAAEAQEVADILQSEGYRVLVQDYDAALGESFPLFIHDALTKARHLLMLHSAGYDSTHWTRQEFANLLAAPDARVAERRVCVLRCDAADPRGLLSGVVYGDLHGATDPAERRRIVLAVARGEAPAARPSGKDGRANLGLIQSKQYPPFLPSLRRVKHRGRCCNSYEHEGWSGKDNGHGQRGWRTGAVRRNRKTISAGSRD